MADPENKDPESTETQFTAEDKQKLEEVVDKERKARRDADAALKEAQKELEQLKSDSDASKSDMERLNESIKSLEQRAEKAERDALVAKVAQAKKLPAALASRLQGDSQEELEADADFVIESLGLSETEEKEETPSGRNKEALRPGASREDDDNFTAEQGEKLADRILSNR